jgi:hypothetical protein
MTDANDTNSGVAAEEPSTWQQAIAGEWYGNPSVFDAQGNHTGFIKVNRSSVFEDGTTTYYMHTLFDNDGPLRSRFEFVEFAFELLDSDTNRVYLGPDFIGAGHPYGNLVDAHYYSPAWRADLRTMVHLVPETGTEIYSSLLYEGPTLFAVFNGVYQVAFDYETNEATRTRIDAFCAQERNAGRRPHDVPAKQAGTWRGEVALYGSDQQPTGVAHMTIEHEPLSLLRARQTVTLEGDISRRWRFDRYHDGNRHTYDGPDLFGNAIAYGRVSYNSLHHLGTAEKIQGRDFLFDEKRSLSVNWKLFDGDRLATLLFGVLEWSPT